MPDKLLPLTEFEPTSKGFTWDVEPGPDGLIRLWLVMEGRRRRSWLLKQVSPPPTASSIGLPTGLVLASHAVT